MIVEAEVDLPVCLVPFKKSKVDILVYDYFSTKETKLQSGSAQLRRSAIAYFYIEIYGTPFVITDLLQRLSMTNGMHNSIKASCKKFVDIFPNPFH